MVASKEKTVSAVADEGWMRISFWTADDQEGRYVAMLFHHDQVSVSVSKSSGMSAALIRYVGSSPFKDCMILSVPSKEKHSSYAIYIANIGSLSLLPFRHVFFFLETNYNRILGHRIEWWNCRTWGMKAWSAGSPFTPLPLDLYSFISASTPSSSLDTPIKSIISYIVRNLVLHFTDLF